MWRISDAKFGRASIVQFPASISHVIALEPRLPTSVTTPRGACSTRISFRSKGESILPPAAETFGLSGETRDQERSRSPESSPALAGAEFGGMVSTTTPAESPAAPCAVVHRHRSKRDVQNRIRAMGTLGEVFMTRLLLIRTIECRCSRLAER